MTWQGNPRTTTPEHRARRQQVLERDQHICHVCRNKINTGPADEVDHIRSWAECQRLGIDPDSMANLAAIHDNPCHRTKSSAEGHAALARQRAARLRPTEQHPGVRSQ